MKGATQMIDLTYLLDEDAQANRRELPEQIRIHIEEGATEITLTFPLESALTFAKDIDYAVEHRPVDDGEGY